MEEAGVCLCLRHSEVLFSHPGHSGWQPACNPPAETWRSCYTCSVQLGVIDLPLVPGSCHAHVAGTLVSGVEKKWPHAYLTQGKPAWQTCKLRDKKPQRMV